MWASSSWRTYFWKPGRNLPRSCQRPARCAQAATPGSAPAAVDRATASRWSISRCAGPWAIGGSRLTDSTLVAWLSLATGEGSLHQVLRERRALETVRRESLPLGDAAQPGRGHNPPRRRCLRGARAHPHAYRRARDPRRQPWSATDAGSARASVRTIPSRTGIARTRQRPRPVGHTPDRPTVHGDPVVARLRCRQRRACGCGQGPSGPTIQSRMPGIPR